MLLMRSMRFCASRLVCFFDDVFLFTVVWVNRRPNSDWSELFLRTAAASSMDMEKSFSLFFFLALERMRAGELCISRLAAFPTLTSSSLKSKSSWSSEL